MKYYSIIITIILLVSTKCYFFKPIEPSASEINLINQRDSLKVEFKNLQAVYDLKSMHVEKLRVELLESKAAVQRSEQALDKAKANERVYLKRIKEQSLKMTDVQADSAIRERFKDDPDSVEQKVFVSLTKLDESDSVRKRLEDFTNKLRISGMLTDSVVVAQGKLLYTSRIQIRTLEKIPEIDYKIIESKDKEIKKLKRRNRILKMAVPVAVALTLIIVL